MILKWNTLQEGKKWNERNVCVTKENHRKRYCESLWVYFKNIKLKKVNLRNTVKKKNKVQYNFFLIFKSNKSDISRNSKTYFMKVSLKEIYYTQNNVILLLLL